jgi:HEAT repeat protein
MVDSDQRLCHGAVLMAGSCIGTLLTLLALAASHPTAAQTQSAIAPSLAQVAQDVESADAGVRRRALRALRDLGGPETLTLLARLADDEEHGIRKDAIETITRIYVEPPAGTRPGNVEDVFQVGPYHVIPWPPSADLTRALTRALADDYPDVRRDAAYAMAIVSPRPASERAAFELIASLSDRDPAVRIAAARALGRLGIKAAGVPLVGRVNDEVLEVRLAAMRALGDVRETRAVPALTDQFEFYVRGVAGRAAIDALARIADDASVPLFESQSGSGYPAHRRAAYEGLARTRAAKVSASRIDGARGSEDDRRVRLAMAYAVRRSNTSSNSDRPELPTSQRCCATRTRSCGETSPRHWDSPVGRKPSRPSPPRDRIRTTQSATRLKSLNSGSETPSPDERPIYFGTSTAGFREKKLTGRSLKPASVAVMTGHSSGRGTCVIPNVYHTTTSSPSRGTATGLP